MRSTLVHTRYGAVQGIEEGPVLVWRGIPYARAPIGKLRFYPPESPDPWAGVRSADKFGPIACQIDAPGILRAMAPAPQSEDCLTLNIWSPAADGKRRPVLVWIHGGAFEFGSGQSPWYDGTSFARLGDIVVVTINYRLGPLGFLHWDEGPRSSGNCGLLDQVQALQWIHENIAAFGGDPDRVTIAGESAGSMSVGALLTTRQAAGLFQQAIMESGVPFLKSPEAAQDTARHVLDALGIAPGDIGALQSVPADRLLRVAQSAFTGTGLAWGPVEDGTTFERPFWQAIESGVAASIPVLIGTNRDEYRLWGVLNSGWRTMDDQAMVALYESLQGTLDPRIREHYLAGKHGQSLFDALMRVGTAKIFWYPTQRFASRQSCHAPVWLYRFDWQSRLYDGVLGACHALEIPFVFNSLGSPGGAALAGESSDGDAVARAVHHAWIQFVREGNPNTPDLPDWPRYDQERRATMIVDTESHGEYDPQGDERQLWEAVYG